MYKFKYNIVNLANNRYEFTISEQDEKFERLPAVIFTASNGWTIKQSCSVQVYFYGKTIYIKGSDTGCDSDTFKASSENLQIIKQVLEEFSNNFCNQVKGPSHKLTKIFL